MTNSIIQMLTTIERDWDVHVFYACEAGSRAWGFESEDSDFDVRFLYVHKPKWYLSTERKEDVIEWTPNKVLDLAGWDMTKALNLLSKSNPPLLEWINAPIVYKENKRIVLDVIDLAMRYFSPNASFYHYAHMAAGNYKEYLQGDTVRTKKYLYVLRPLLAAQWVIQNRGMVPVLFETLVEELLSGDIKAAVLELIAKKRAGLEQDIGPRIDVINRWIEGELQTIQRQRSILGKNEAIPFAEKDAVFHRALEIAWNVTLEK